jgi:hypothetical protein
MWTIGHNVPEAVSGSSKVTVTSVDSPAGSKSECPTTGPGLPSASPWTAMKPGDGKDTVATTIVEPSESWASAVRADGPVAGSPPAAVVLVSVAAVVVVVSSLVPEHAAAVNATTSASTSMVFLRTSVSLLCWFDA